MDPRNVEAHALLVLLEERIAALWAYRKWYRVNRGWLTDAPIWRQMEDDDKVEILALIRLLRKARFLAAPVVEQQEAQAEALAAGDFYAWPA